MFYCSSEKIEIEIHLKIMFKRILPNISSCEYRRPVRGTSGCLLRPQSSRLWRSDPELLRLQKSRSSWTSWESWKKLDLESHWTTSRHSNTGSFSSHSYLRTRAEVSRCPGIELRMARASCLVVFWWTSRLGISKEFWNSESRRWMAVICGTTISGWP